MKSPRRNSLTIHQVAKSAGVSVTTVSRVLNNKDDVSPETFERVNQVIQELGYTSNLAARSMRGRRTNLIGLIVPDVATPYISEVLKGVNRAIVQSDYDLLIYTSARAWNDNHVRQEPRHVMLLNGSIADGVVVVVPIALDFTSHAPLVIIDPNHASPQAPSIYATNYEGSRSVVDYLLSLGHRRIGYITGRPDLVSANQRLQAYKDGMMAAGISLDEALIQIGDYTTETAVQCAFTLLALKDRPTAIIGGNDMSAIGVYQAAAQAGLKIPQDLSVAGFDNITETTYLSPPLTTINQFISEMGSLAIEMVIRLIKGETLETSQCIIPTQLIVRDSCRSLR